MTALMLVACSGSAPSGTSGGLPTTSAGLVSRTVETSPTTVTTPTSTAEPTTTTTRRTTPGEAAAPEGWVVHTGVAAGLAAPPGWIDAKALLDDPGVVEDGLEALGNEDLAAFITSIGEETLELIDILLVDEATLSDGFATNVNVVATPVGPITDLITVQQAIEAQIPALGGGLVGTSVEDIAGVETLVVDYTIAGAQADIEARQFHQLAEEQLLTLTFAGSERERGLWRRMASTLSPAGSG